MDPITIMSILVLAGFIGAGADLATGGLVRAEFGGGSRGAAGYLGSAGRKRWQESKRLARQERMKTPTGRAVQFILDELGGLGRGVVRGWRSGARRGRKQWRECLNGQPIPAVRAWRGASESARTWLDERAAQLAPNGPNGAGQDPIEARTGTPNGDPERGPEQAPNGPNGDPEREGDRAWWDPNGITEDPFLGGPERDPNGATDGDALPPRCPDCGMPIVLPDGLNAHRLGRDRCPYADLNETPNGDPNGMPANLPSPAYGSPATGDRDPHVFDCGCCGTVHEPLEPGAHCPNCHLHDHAPNDPNAPTQPTRTEGTAMTDVNSAPAAIAAWEAITPRWESLQSRTDALQGEIDSLKSETDALDTEIATLADGMGDFAIGGEADVAGAIGEVTAALASAKEQVDNATTGFTSAKERTGAYVDNLHLEYDASIEAAAGKVADAHSVMQEV